MGWSSFFFELEMFVVTIPDRLLGTPLELGDFCFDCVLIVLKVLGQSSD
jgi:hypothetical protein